MLGTFRAQDLRKETEEVLTLRASTHKRLLASEENQVKSENLFE